MSRLSSRWCILQGRVREGTFSYRWVTYSKWHTRQAAWRGSGRRSGAGERGGGGARPCNAGTAITNACNHRGHKRLQCESGSPQSKKKSPFLAKKREWPETVPYIQGLTSQAVLDGPLVAHILNDKHQETFFCLNGCSFLKHQVFIPLLLISCTFYSIFLRTYGHLMVSKKAWKFVSYYGEQNAPLNEVHNTIFSGVEK